MKASNVMVLTGTFEREHGVKPRGLGSWLFRCGNVTVCSSPDVMMYSEAKKKAQEFAAARNERIVKLLP